MFEAALSGDQKFDEAAKDAASRIQKSVDFDPGAYLKHYLDISGSLRTLANNYIRLFSSNEKDMLTQYRELVALANEWTYVDEFSERSREYTKSLAADDSDKSKRVAEYDAQSSSARSVVVNTSKQVAELAAKTAHGKGFYV